MKIDRKKLAQLATIRVYVRQDEVRVRGNATASGDDGVSS